MGEDVSYRSGSWDDMGRAIAKISAWGGALERMQQMDRTLQQIQNAIDDLDEDRRLWFSYKSQAGALDKLGQDYRKLDTFTGEAGNAVSRQIDDPFYKQMDAFVAEMSQISINQYHTQNTLNVKEYQAASPLVSVATYEQVTKQSITFDDIFNSSSLMAASLKKEYEAYRAAAGKQAGDVTFDQYKEGIQYIRGFDYQSIKDKQMDQEFWVNLGIGAAIVILTITCPPAGIAAGAAYGAMQLTDAATGTSLISGRKLSTEERVTEGVFGVLDVVPAFKAAGAFSAIGRMGTKGVTTLGGLTKTMGRESGRRLLELKQAGRTGIDSVKQAATNVGDRISLGGLQPEFAGASGVGDAGSGESFVQNVKSTFRQIASKESVTQQVSYSKIEEVKGAAKINTTEKHFSDVKPPSSYQERLSQTPVNHGEWMGQRGESTFISDYDEVKNILEKKDLAGIEYSDAIPDFSPISVHEVEISNMTTDRRLNFRNADELLAQRFGVTRKEIVKLRKQQNLTWHELNDMKTMQLVPTVINSKFGHLGGVAEIKILLGIKE
ncbi:HNH endonuclease [Sporolactobacillus putidus]|uniref:Pre-toxin TG domain-containing protein n=1 Tax=Sporolactobacillus putidus TaxID=492735 RepID=A0A917S5D3_9BACL|nr:HNH endonuclease [Sporolactobacillus putidus]GGL58304.1 hypothetical protein GCM10007968_22850 [Sporolactobacillus putidus]